MKIGIVCYPTFGGSGVVATELGKALASKGHDVHFISYSQPVRLSGFTENIYYHEVTVNDYPLFDYTPYEMVLTSKLVDVALHENLDVFHVHYAIPHASAALMAQQILRTHNREVPVVTTLHGTDITLVGKDPSYEPVITWAINQSTLVTAVSESLKEDTLKHFGVKRPINVVPNFICLEQYKPTHDKALQRKYAPDGEKIVMHMSNFRPVKRVDDVVKAFALMRKEVPAKLLFIGDGPERLRIEKLCREMGVCKDTRFLGKVRDIAGVLSIADLFMITSETESFGLSALEAMASGIPVISTNSGGQSEVNEHGFSGFLSDVGDTVGMAENALKLLRDEDMMKRFSQQARARAELFDIHAILPKYEALYEEAVAFSRPQIQS